MHDYQFSEFGKQSLIPSAVNQMTADFASDFRPGVDINLGVGYVNDDTIPSDIIEKAMSEVLSRPQLYRNPLNYGGAEGSTALRRSIKEFYIRNNIGELKRSYFNDHRILIGANGATSLLEAFADVLEPGVVITPNPFYYIYTEFLERKGFTILPIDEDENGIRIDLLEKELQKVSKKEISFFYIPTVNNPTCTVTSSERIKQIVELVDKYSKTAKRLIPVLFDKAYQELVYGENTKAPVSGLKYNKNGNVFEIGTISKIVAPALRIGYLIAQPTQMLKVITQKISDTGFSAPLINQELTSYILDNFIEQQIANVNIGYKRKADFLATTIHKELKPWLKKLTGGQAGFYYYLEFENIKTDQSADFFKFLSRKTGDREIDGEDGLLPRLIYIPGEICSKGKRSTFQMRISFGFEEKETLEKAVKLIKSACEYASTK